MKRKYNDDAEIDARAHQINSRSNINRLGPPPRKKMIPCPRCNAQALLDIVDKQWCYCCLACSEETPAGEE